MTEPRHHASAPQHRPADRRDVSGHTALLVDAAAAAEMLGISTRNLWSLTKRGAVPVRRIGRSVRYSPTELQSWVAAGCPTEPGAAERLRKGGRS
jgi:predicted DNA-binding transcriptional regulator AlpA